MPTIRNTSARDLEIAGRVIRAGETVEVGAGEASHLAANPNFETVTAPPADEDDKPRRGGKKD